MEQKDIRKSSAKNTKSVEEISKTKYSSKRKRKTSKYEYYEKYGAPY